MTKQQVIPGTLSPAEVQAARTVDARDQVEHAKARLVHAMDKLEAMMLEEDRAEVTSQGVRFRRTVTEKLKVENYHRPEPAAGDGE